MKNTPHFFILILLAYATGIMAQTTGQLDVTTTTSSAGGNYAPRNIVAIWIEDAEGNFVKTLLAYAQNRRTHLNTWQASTAGAGTEFNVVDAITGATRTSHGTRSCSWNATDFQGLLMPDGSYSVWMELTDKNNTGNFSSFSFVKGSEPATLNPADVPSFSGIAINWVPNGTVNITENVERAKIKLSPNPSSDYITVSGNITGFVKVSTMSGEVLIETTNSYIDIRALSKGIYLVSAETAEGLAISKMIRQ